MKSVLSGCLLSYYRLYSAEDMCGLVELGACYSKMSFVFQVSFERNVRLILQPNSTAHASGRHGNIKQFEFVTSRSTLSMGWELLLLHTTTQAISDETFTSVFKSVTIVVPSTNNPFVIAIHVLRIKYLLLLSMS
jgi:hypothetical protein